MKLETGKLYKPGISHLPEGIKFEFSQSGGILEIVFYSPSKEEINEFKKGKIKLGLFEKEGIVFFLIKFGHLNWMDAPYNIELSKPYEFMELADENKGFSLQIIVVDGKTGIVKVLRFIGLPHELSKTFKKYVEIQKTNPVKNYNLILNQIYNNFTTDDFVKLSSIYSL